MFKKTSTASFRASSMAAISNFLLPLLFGFALLHLVSGQNPSGFISLDCGLPAFSSYTDPTTGIKYDSDAAFITTGTVHNISSDDNTTNGLNQQLWSLRSFPEGFRNCYNLKVVRGTKYLIRASFLYGNYDGRRRSPEFELHLGANLWDSVGFDRIDTTVNKEILHVVSSSNLQVCVVNAGSGTPFISALELRPLSNSTYEAGNRTLATVQRLDYGAVNNRTFRYKDDVYDRIWDPQPPLEAWASIYTSEQVDVYESLLYQPPPAVMNTAVTPKNATAPIEFQWLPPDTAARYFFYIYFAELEKLRENQTRAFDIFMNGNRWYSSTISLDYLTMFIIYSRRPMTRQSFDFSIVRAANSTLPPILNAFEVYQVIDFPQSETNEEDVEAIIAIKARYGVTRNWEGDPCAPLAFVWQGLSCSSSVDSESPRITSLDLSSSGLTGEIAQNIADLKMLETLNLSNNSLSGPVPDFLTQLPSLRVLNLERNNLNGIIPSQLMEKSKSGSLTLSFGENPNLFGTPPNEEKESHIIVPIVASVGGFVLLSLLVAAAYIFWRTKRKQGESRENIGQSQQWEMTKRHYSYSKILRITNNFERLLGQGGFGRVYYGRIENTEVAIKMLSPQSAQGYQQFQSEVDLLMRVHHKNLIGLIGYCNESTNKALIYEYMSGGNLGSLMSGGKSYVLNWEDRLHLALDAAHGLEYLHHGIRPAIVHRDVKSSNILLDDNFRAKVSDFGLSRIFPNESGATHVTTNVVGTPGYIDPEYYTSYRLNEKSDVYGFGIVLLEIITGKPVLTKTEDNITYIFQWVDSMLSQGDISSIIDPKLKEDFDVNSIWKAVDIAISCASPNSANRPNMSQVVVELNECLAMELAHTHRNHHPSETVITDSISLFGPSAR